jgi:hypothetical protein
MREPRRPVAGMFTVTPALIPVFDVTSPSLTAGGALCSKLPKVWLYCPQNLCSVGGLTLRITVSRFVDWT